MKKILAVFLAVFMLFGMFTAMPVMADDTIEVLNEDFGKVKVMGKVQTSYNGSTAYAVRSSYGESETQDVIHYFVRNTNQDSTSGMELNPAFDFFPNKRLVSKSSSTVFESVSIYGGDERTPVSLSGFGWIGATHGMTCGVTVTSTAHGVTYSSIGNIYVDENNIEWVLLRVATEDKLVFISKNLKSGSYTKPTFHSAIGTTLTNTADAEDVIAVESYKSGQQLRPAYKMSKQEIYVVNNGERTLVSELGTIYEGDYCIVEEEYTIKNPVYIAQTLIDERPEGGYTENPSLAVGKDLVTFDLQQIYNSDGTVVHNWETTYHQDADITCWGGIQYGAKGDYIYYPNSKPFTDNSSVTINSTDIKESNLSFDFSNLFDSRTGFPSSSGGSERWADSNYIPHRRLDFVKNDSGSVTSAFAGGFIPVFDNENSERIQNASSGFYSYKSRKSYFHSAESKINTRYPDMTDITLKGSAYKKWIEDFDAAGNTSYYSVPYFSDGETSRYMYFDIYKPGVTKKYDISSYLGTYSISELESSANLEYEINYDTGILTVSSLENNQTAADALVLKAKYVGESVPAVEAKIRALPELYDVSINDKLDEVAALMESVGAPIEDYAVQLIEKYNSLLAQKAAYEQAMADEEANAERVEGLNNKYVFVDLKFPHDAFATDNDFAADGWFGKELADDPTNPLVYKGFTMQAYGTLSQPAKDNHTAYRASEINTVSAIKQDEEGNYIYTIGKVPFKLGEIETEDGKIGANAAIFRRQLKTDGYTGTEPLNTLSTTEPVVYKMEGVSGITKATITLNATGVSNVNLILSDLYVSSAGPNRYNKVTIEYADGGSETINAVYGRAYNAFKDGVYAVPVSTFDAIMADTTKTSSVSNITAYSLDEYKALVAKYVDQATADAVTALPSGWGKTDASKAVHAGLVAETKYAALINSSPVLLTSIKEDIDSTKLEGISSSTRIVVPTSSEQFLPARRRNTGTTNYSTTYLSNVSIPTDSDREIKNVVLSGALSDSSEPVLASGGFYQTDTNNIATGALMLKYNGSNIINVDGVDYYMYTRLTRQCGDVALYGMTLTNEETWLDRVAEIEEKMLALNKETSSFADVEAIRAEIKDLLSQNVNIIYVKDFSEAARNHIDEVEEYLKAIVEEEERLENLNKTTFEFVDMNKYGKDDIYATVEEYTAATGQFGYANTLPAAIKGLEGVEKTEGDVTYKEFYTLDDVLLGVLDVANNVYYFNATNSSYQEDAFTFLGQGYKFKYDPNGGSTKYSGIQTKDNALVNVSSVNGVYVWYRDGKGPYSSKGAVALNKAALTNGSIRNGDSVLPLLTDVKEYTATNLITGEDVETTKGVLTTGLGNKFEIGPIAPSNNAVINGVMLDTEKVVIPFGEDGVNADYVNILANIIVTNSVNTSFTYVNVTYENEDGSTGIKTYGLILSKSATKSGSIYSETVQDVIDYSIFKVEKSKAQNSWTNIYNNKEATSGLSLENIKFNTKAEDIILYPTEMVNVGTTFTQHTFYPNPANTYAGVYKIPVSEFYKIKSIEIQGNNGCGGFFNTESSDFYVEGSYISSNSAAVPVEVTGGEENYNYYAIYSPTWHSRSYLYAVSTEKNPALPKIQEIEALMQTATKASEIAVVEKLYDELTYDGSVKATDFNSEILEKYTKAKEDSDVGVNALGFEYKNVDDTTVEVTIPYINPTKLAGKPYTIIVVYKDKDDNFISAEPHSFLTTTDAVIKTKVTAKYTGDARKFVILSWKDLATLKPLEAIK